MLYIRLDEIGKFKGTEHRSVLVSDDNCPDTQEGGVSCFRLRDSEGIKDLVSYWEEFVFMCGQYQGMQITVFDGGHVCYGTDNEDIAECYETLLEMPAVEIMAKLAALRPRRFDDSTDAYDAEVEAVYELIMDKIA